MASNRRLVRSAKTWTAPEGDGGAAVQVHVREERGAVTPLLLSLAGAVVGLAVGWAMRRPQGQPDARAAALRRLAATLAQGRRPSPEVEEDPEVRALLEALERGWTPRNEERERSLKEALGRIAAFLRESVRGPLGEALQLGEAEALRAAAEKALEGLDDLEFFLREPLTPDEVHNLSALLQQVTREFASDWDILVRLDAEEPVRAHIQKDMFLDAVYLLLHNAAQFGRGGTVDVGVTRAAGQAHVRIRDHGPGFSPEALERAHDLFYTTSASGLGLGIPFARKIIESFGGEIHLRNVPDGGAEVELSLPAV